jgi:hypothetical protein
MRGYINILIISIISSITIYLLSTCTNTCNSEPTEGRKVRLGFFKTKGNDIVDTTINSVFVYNRIDSFFYNAQKTSQINLELDQNNDSSIFYFKTDSVDSYTIDTLTFSYKRKIQLISSECGFNTIFDSLKLKNNYTRNIIDTIILVKPDINAEVKINYKIILKLKTI